MFEKIGMSERDLKEYSLTAIIREKLNGRPIPGWAQSASDEVSKRAQRFPNGFFVPWDVLTYKRTLEKGTGTGGDLVQTTIRPQNFVEFLYNSMKIAALGSSSLDGLVGDILLPKLIGKNSAYWVSEGNSPTESDTVFGQIPMAPKTLACFTQFSRKLLLQACLDVELFTQKTLAKCMALEVDRVCIAGGLNPGEPTGIIQWPSVGNVICSGGLSFAKIVEFETDVAQANALSGKLAYLVNSTIAGTLKQTAMFPLSASIIPIWVGDTNRPGWGILNGYPGAVSEQVPAGSMIFGNFEDCVVGRWSAIDALIDVYSLGSSGGVIVRLFSDLDVAILHAGSFAISTDVPIPTP